MQIRLRRAYEPPGPQDGTRVLVDRVWPRGISKERAAIDEWLKDVAPSKELRQWFGHDPAKWEEFVGRYHRELAQGSEALERLRALTREGRVTLVYGARDERHNNAVALKEYLEGRGGK